MKLLLTVATSALVLSGCAGHDQFAEPITSLTTLRQALERCASSLPANDPKKYSDLASCQMAAERDLAVATHMDRMDVFDVYARDMRQVGADLDADKFAPDEAMARTNEIREEYLAKCECTPLTGTVMLNMTGPIGPVTNGPITTGPTHPHPLTVSRQVGPLVKEAQTLAQAMDYKGAGAKLDEADAVKSVPDDATVINQIRHYISVASVDPNTPAGAKAKFANDYNDGRFADVIADGELLREFNELDPQSQLIIGQAYYKAGDYAGCVKYAKTLDSDVARQLEARCAYELSHKPQP